MKVNEEFEDKMGRTPLVFKYAYKSNNRVAVSTYVDEKGIIISITKEVFEVMVNGWNEGNQKSSQTDIIRADAEDERSNLLAFICKKYDIPPVDMNYTVDEWEELKEQKNEAYT